MTKTTLDRLSTVRRGQLEKNYFYQAIVRHLIVKTVSKQGCYQLEKIT